MARTKAHLLRVKEAPVKKLVGVVSTLAITASIVAAAPAQAGAPGAAATSTTAAKAVQPKAFRMIDRYARETVTFGSRDASVYDIEHVLELQYRLKWAGFFKVNPTGNFGTLTRSALKKYQRSIGLRVTGVATHRTWQHLLPDTLRRKGAIPNICKAKGWHACYDRTAHQVTLWHRGKIHNTWLVRGGSYSTPTRTGNTVVYKRDIDHKSGLFDGAPMPYSQFFDGGQAYHGSRFMMDPFVEHSHGCINMYVEDARQLWRLTATQRLNVSVYGGWDKSRSSKSSTPVEP
jgi:hypothetical protein